MFSHWVMSYSLWPHRLQRARLLCPPLSPRVCSDSYPLSRWCYLTISSSSSPFFFCLQSFPASGSFPMSELFVSSGQSFGASALVLPKNIQDWFPLGLTVWSPCSPGDSQESSPTPQFKSINSLALSIFYCPVLTSVHDYWKNQYLDWFFTIQTSVGKIMSLFLNIVSKFVLMVI